MSGDFFPLEYLLSIRKPEEVSDFIKSIDFSYKWENIGKDETNFPRLGFSQSGVKAIIERITNAIDAIIENKKEMRKDKQDNIMSCPRKAIQDWFGIKGGHIDSLDEKERRNLAQESIIVKLEDSGIEKKPTIICKDAGIGIHPEEFEKTIVGLGGSLKRSKPYLLGAYGWGGSQTFIWCNGAYEATDVDSLPLAIIVSRKNPNLLSQDQEDQVGWTIVRYKDNPNEKHGVFQYLVDNDGKIFKTSPKNLPKDFLQGTQITHLAYNLEGFYGRMTLASYRLFQSLLFDPVLPFWLYDSRSKEGRTISGNLSRLSADEKNFVEYKNTHTASLSLGEIKIRYWVLKSKTEGYHIDSYLKKSGSAESIIITLNGQQYGTLSKQIIKDAGFAFLSDYLIFQIECDSLSPQMKKNIFPTTREDIREQYKEVFRSEILSILQSDEDLKKLEESRRKEHLTSGNEESTKRIRRLLDKLITINKKVIVGGEEGANKTKKKEYKGRDPPSFLKILPETKDLEFIPGEEKKIVIQTDAENDFLVRDEDPGDIECFIDNSLIKYQSRRGFLRDGKIGFYITIEKDVVIGSKGKIICTIKLKNKELLRASKNLEIVSAPCPLLSNYPPTIFEIANDETPLLIKRGRRSLIQINCDGPDGLLERPVDKASLNVSFFPNPGIEIIGNSDLINHKIRIFLKCPEKIESGKRFDVLAKIILSNRCSMQSQRPGIIIEPPKDSGEEGKKEVEMPNYDIRTVQPEDRNWNEFKWDEKNVGKFMKSGDQLILYVSLGNEHYLNTLNSNEVSGDKIEEFKEKYISYIAYHLWLQYEDNANNEEETKIELRRLCQTVLLALSQDPRFR